jgi:hypothetical protein
LSKTLAWSAIKLKILSSGKDAQRLRWLTDLLFRLTREMPRILSLRTSPQFGTGGRMQINEQKVDEMSLALLYLTTFK